MFKVNKLKLFLLALVFILSPPLLRAQNTSTGNITTAGTDCTTSTTCVVFVNQPNYGGAGITIKGTWSGTLQFEGAANGDGSNSSYYTALGVTPFAGGGVVTSATAVGQWTVNTSGLVGVRVRASTLSSGTAVITINSSFTSASNRSSSAGGGSTFDTIGSGTNITAAMIVGSGASLSATGTGAIKATGLGAVTVSGAAANTNCLVASSSSAASWTACPGGGSPAFSAITSATNTTAAMVLGTGSSLTVSGSGTNNATTLGGATFAAPGAIGGGTAAAGTFTTLTANTSLVINGGTALTTTNQSGTGNLCLTTSCVMTTPNLGTPSALNLTNATSPPTWNQNTTGNASTATAFASSPSACTSGSALNTMDASGNCSIGLVVNAMTALGDVEYGGAAGALTRLAGPTGPNGVPEFLTDTPAAGAAVAEVFSLAGVPVNNNSETTCAAQTLNILDRATFMDCSGGTTSTVTLPVHTTAGFGQSFVFLVANNNSGTMTFSPTTDTIDTATLLSNWADWLYITGATWKTVQVPQLAAFGATCSNGVTWSTTTNFGCQASAPVLVGQTNVYTSGLQDFTAGTMEIPEGAGATANVNSTLILDTTNNNIHGWVNGADGIFGLFASTPTTGDCVKATVTSSNVLLADAGAACGSGGGGAAALSNTTAVTVSNPSAATDTQLMEISLTAGYLNTGGQPYVVYGAGVLSTSTASVPQVTITAKLCSVSGCGSGTVTPLGAIQSSALNTTAITNATWTYGMMITTVGTGASCNFISKANPGLEIDLAGTIAATADSVFLDGNTAATSPNQNCANALFLDFFVQQSTTGASNSYKQLVATVNPQATPTATSIACSGVTNGVCNNAANTYTSAGADDLSAASPTVGLKVPVAAAAAPTANGAVAYDSTCNDSVFGANGATHYLPFTLQNFASGDQITAAGAFATTLSVPGGCLFSKSLITIRAHGSIVTTGTAAPLMNWEVNAGGTTGICPAAAANAALTVTSTGVWDVTCYIEIATTGSSGTSYAYGQFAAFKASGLTFVNTLPNAFVNSSTVTYNTTGSQTVSIQETATLVSGQTFNLQYITVNVNPE